MIYRSKCAEFAVFLSFWLMWYLTLIFSHLILNLSRQNQTEENAKDEVYEVDADPDRIDEEMTRSQADTITKQGYLYKGPDTASDRMFAHIGSKSFKRRFVTSATICSNWFRFFLVWFDCNGFNTFIFHFINQFTDIAICDKRLMAHTFWNSIKMRNNARRKPPLSWISVLKSFR